VKSSVVLVRAGALVVVWGAPNLGRASSPVPEGPLALHASAATHGRTPIVLRARLAWEERAQGFDLRWTTFALTESPWSRDRSGPRLVELQFQEDGLALGSAGAFSGLGSALGGLVSRGLPLVDRLHASRLPHRQYLRAYFRPQGAVVAWRIDF
jgi:hypothetical protein